MLIGVDCVSFAVEHRGEHDLVRNGLGKFLFTDNDVHSCVDQAVFVLAVFEINGGSAL